MEIAGRTLVVTGGGNGIGQQVVFELLRRGANVAAVDLRAESLEQTVAEAGVGDRLRTYTVDVTDRAAVEALPAQVVADFGAVDGLLNVAGIIQPFVRLVDLEYDAIERVLAVNLWGTIHTVKAFLPLLLERPVAHVVNVSSMGGFLPVPGQTIYGASKAAVKLLSEGLFAELLDTNVGVSVVMPGAVGTDITGNSGVAVPGGADAAAAEEGGGFPTTSPQDAASTIVDGIVDDRLHVYVGRDARLMNIAVRTAPKQAARLITRQMAALLDG
jgi:NAD(P)-dependent dehydrogenase (short-subunit alcohol dehydrogenase family)